jgi:hypothetical protein
MRASIASRIRCTKASARANGPSACGEALPAAWRKAASDPLFRQAQDQVSDKLYYMPAMKAAGELHLHFPLSKFALYDAIIQHGTDEDSDSLGAIIRAANRDAGGPPEGGRRKVAHGLFDGAKGDSAKRRRSGDARGLEEIRWPRE